MRNRIVSLVLAVVMVLLAVPAFVLPLTAASTTGFKTVFSKTAESWPLYNEDEFLGYGTPWEVGYFQIDQGGAYTRFSGYDATYNILNLSGSDQWTYGGIYCDNTRYILTGSGVAKDLTVEGATPHRIALVLNYVSPYEGKVDLGFDSIIPVNAETVTCLDMYISIYINGEMIWPVAGGDVADPEDWAHILDAAEATNTSGKSALEQFAAINPDALKGVEVTRGDNIQFALSRGGTNYGYAEPTVTFADGYLVVPSAMTDTFGYTDSDWPTLGAGQGTRTFKQTDERWTIGDIDVATGEFAAFTNYFRRSTDSWACHTGQDFPGNGKNESNGAVLLASGVAEMRGAIMFGDVENYYNGFAYDAVATGKVNPFFANLKLLAEEDGEYVVATSGTAKIHVYKNGTLVETVTATATADGVTVDMPTDIAVVRGDEIVLAASKGNGTIAVAGNPTVTYSAIDSFMTEVVEDTYAVKLENGTALFGDGFGISFYTYATTAVYNDFVEAGVYVWKGVAAADRTAENATIVPATMNNSFAFVAEYSDLVAKEMADDIAVQSFVKVNTDAGEQVIVSEVYEKSVADYVSEQYTTTKDTELKKVLVAMLNYGAYAQTYFNYNTENLANAILSENDKAMDKEIQYWASFDAQKGSTNNICNTEIYAFSLELENSVDLKVHIKVDGTESGSKMQIQVAESKEELGSDIKVDINENNPVYVIEDISLTEMSKTFYFRVTVRYGPTLYYGYVFSYSVESYAARMVDSTEPGLSDLVRSMMEFGKAINAYNA